MPGETGEHRWPYPVIESGSKMGVHSIFPNRVERFAQTLVEGGAAFPVVKAVDDLGWLQRVKQVSPDTIILARLTSRHEGCERVEDPSVNLDTLADRLVRVIRDKLTAIPDLRNTVDYWEIINEADPPGAEGYRRLALLMFECMERAEADGLKLALFSFNAGTPEWEEMLTMVETGVFGRALQGGHILALHEGVFGTDQAIDHWWGDTIPGSPTVAGAGPLCFRYRYLYHLLQQRNEVIPLVVSEFYAGGGYEQDGVALEEVVRRMAWYDERARQDYWVLGFLPFTLGPVGQWMRSDYEFAYPALIEYVLSIKAAQNALPTDSGPPSDTLTPVVMPQRGAPREQYERIYVLLPPGADSNWASAAIHATWDDHQYTVGGSADDAGIGDLDSRTVIAINPSHWQDDLEVFFQTHYPGVRYIPLEAATPQQLVTRLQSVRL